MNYMYVTTRMVQIWINFKILQLKMVFINVDLHGDSEIIYIKYIK